MSSIYFIDGYNVIYHSSLLRPLVSESIEIAREALINKVERFCSISGERAKIFFDGRGRHEQLAVSSDKVPGLDIVFSHGDLSADALIERLVYQASNKREIIVVSADNGIRELCRGIGSFVMSSDNFLQKVREAISDMGTTLDLKHQDSSSPRIEDHLDETTLERLKKLKDSLP